MCTVPPRYGTTAGPNGLPYIWRYALLLMAVWTFVVAGSLVLDRRRSRKSMMGLAEMQALAHFEKDVSYRHWAAGLGGVYAPVTPDTPPNVHLADVPERDMETPSGRKLTLINPAYMTRLVHELAQREWGARGHITSLNPLRAENAPDAWEAEALQRIAAGAERVASVEWLDNEPHMRLIKPLLTERVCLKCHAVQGYQLGDVRGGISVSIPMAPFFAAERTKLIADAISHGAIWLVGLIGIGWGARRVHSHQIGRAAAERDTQEQKERLAATLHSIGDGVISTDERGRIVAMNPVAERLTGWALEEAAGRPFDEVFHLVDSRTGHQVASPVGEVLATGKCVELSSHTRLVSADGHRYDIADSAAPIRIAGGAVTGVVLVFQDVTQRKQAEDELQHALDQQRAIFDASLVGIMVLKNRVISTVNRRMAEMLGFEVDELVGKGPQQVHLSLENYHEFGEKYYWRLAENELVGIEYPLRHKDGHRVWCRFSGRAIAPPDLGKGAVWIIDDLTEQRRSEQRQAAETRRIATLLQLNRMDEQPWEAITAFAVDEAIQLTGSRAGYLTVLSDDESVATMRYWSESGNPVHVAPNPQVPTPARQDGPWTEALRQRRPVIVNTAGCQQPDGSSAQSFSSVRHLSVPVFHGKRVVAVAGVLDKESDYDEHDLHQLQLLLNGWWQVVDQQARRAELLHTRDELRRNVEALEYTNLSLEQYIEKAEAATCAKSQFLANMSHEIRTPLTAILGFADILLDEEQMAGVPGEWLDSLRTIRRNGDYLLGLINDILDLSKIEAGKLEAHRVRCSPAELLAELASLLRVRADAKGLSLAVEFGSPIPETIHTDPLRLRQILINLVGNAIKFTEAGGIRVVAQLVEPAGDRPAMRFDVMDSGIGMSAEQQSRLFLPFSQVDSSMTRRFGGTGLGLTISRQLANMLGGDIHVDSVPGQGSTFRVTIETGPLDNVVMLDGPEETFRGRRLQEKRPQPTEPAAKLAGRLLLAEDGPDNQRLFAFLLRKAGAELTIAENGQIAYETALAAWRTGTPFDVILMDMQMPVMDGYTATARLRKEGYQGPIIALTAHAMEGAEQECRDAGCDGYAKKPIDRDELLSTLATYLAANESRCR